MVLWATFKKIFRVFGSQALACILISLAVSGAVLGVRALGWFQRAELIAYDKFRSWKSRPEATDSRIVIVGMTEEDLRSYGFPLSDTVLLELLHKIHGLNPCVIGLDIYRDLPEPRIRTGQPEQKEDEARYRTFGEALLAMEKLVVIRRVGVIDEPPVYKEAPDRVGANNLLKDYSVDGVYRRAPIFVIKGVENPMPSLSTLLAVRYLEANGKEVAFVTVPGEKPGEETNLLKLGNVTFQPLTKDAGGYVNLGISDYEYLPDFAGPFTFRNMDREQSDPYRQGGTNTPYDYSFSDILRGAVPAQALEGKIVLVATVMQSIKDSNPTPVHDNLRGVQYHATLVRQLLDAAYLGKPPLRWWPEWGEILWIIGCTMAGGVLGLWLRSPWKLVPGMLLLIGCIGLAAWQAFEGEGYWLLLAAPATGCLIAATTVTSYVVALERADRRTVQQLFSKHVSKRVADAVFEQREQLLAGGKMAPQSFTGTVIFTDLANFSTTSEKLTAQQTMRWLNEYMDVMAAIVERHDGTINKYIGDAIMAVFGAPLVSPDDVGIRADAVRAIRCALQMRQEVPILNARWKETSPDMPPVSMRVGIFTGPLVHGSFGSAERMEWTVIGDTVNRANRLEAAGKEIKDQLSESEKLCSILIGPESFTRAGDLFETVPVPDMPLKGISERVTVYRVLAERPKPSSNQSPSS